MATTPEGKIKQQIKKILDSHAPFLYYYMPVPNGYGRPTVDYLGCICGFFFSIEAKKPGGKPTALQAQVMLEIDEAGGKSFVIDGEKGLTALADWCAMIRMHDNNIRALGV